MTPDIYKAALEYVFGPTDPLDWQRIVEEKLTPPWPLEQHAKAMGWDRYAKDEVIRKLEAKIAQLEKDLSEAI